jgi:hypothetical protein
MLIKDTCVAMNTGWCMPGITDGCRKKNTMAFRRRESAASAATGDERARLEIVEGHPLPRNVHGRTCGTRRWWRDGENWSRYA